MAKTPVELTDKAGRFTMDTYDVRDRRRGLASGGKGFLHAFGFRGKRRIQI